MMTRAFSAAASVALFLSLGGAARPQEATVWRNPGNSVHIRAAQCGNGAMCATVVWANDKAKADARRGGTDPLIGTQLFRNFKASSAKEWKGQVFVPDLNKTFSGTVTLVDDDHLLGKGCVLMGLICKEQVWTRVQ